MCNLNSSPWDNSVDSSLVFSCDQAALWMVQPVRLSVCLSVCLSYLFHYVPIIVSSFFRSYYHWQKWCPCKRSRPEVKGEGQRGQTLFSRFRTVTPVRIHICWWYDAQSLMLLRRCALLFFKVIRQISRSHGSNSNRFWPELGVSGV